MKVIKKGGPQYCWSEEFICTGKGNGDNGCWATLLVSRDDLYYTTIITRRENSIFITFCCPCCGAETDIDANVPFEAEQLPSRDEWNWKRRRK